LNRNLHLVLKAETRSYIYICYVRLTWYWCMCSNTTGCITKR